MVHYFLETEEDCEIQDREHCKFFYWEVFDPIRVEWKFEKREYLRRVRDFREALDEGLRERETFTW